MSSRLLALFMAITVAACSSSSRRPRRPGQEYLAAIEMTGNTAIETDALVRGLSLDRARRGGRGIDEYQLSLDVQRIESAYQRRGYLNVVVDPRVEREGDAATLIFDITEGPQATAIVDISGLPTDIPAEEARALVPLENGAPFSYSAYDAAKGPLLALVENAGYAHAQLDASVLADRANNRAILRYVIDPGPRVTFGDIEVIGADGSLAEAIRERAPIEPGGPYSTQAVAETQQAIFSIGRFTSVRVDVDRASRATVVPVKITVAMAKRNELRVGGGAGVDSATYQARAIFSYTHSGWPSPLTKLGVEARPALVALRDDCSWYEVWTCELNLRARLIGTITQQDLFTRGLNGEVQGGLDYLAIEAYTYYGPRVKLGINLPLAKRRLHAQAGWQFGMYRFDDFDPALDELTRARIGVDRTQRVGAFTQGVSIDFRDDPVSPKLGVYAAFNIAEGKSYAGSAFDYIQLSPDVRGYLPLGPFVLAARARVGVIRGDVPPTERYYAGGASSQRGFAERRLSPLAYERDMDGNVVGNVVIGGAAMFDTSLELRTHFRLFGERMGFVAFLDGGDVTEDPDALSVRNLHWAAGIGIRPYYLPVGPLRLEFAYRLNRRTADDPAPGDSWNWLLTVGEAF